MNVVVFTSDNHNWCLKPFSILFNKYWGDGQKVDIAGYSVPNFDLPDNFKFHSIAQPQYGKNKWVEGAIRFFNSVDYMDAVILLEDYWITRSVDVGGIYILNEFLISGINNNVLRVDLTGDRLYAGGCVDCGYLKRFDLVQARGSQYEMSLQAGIWNIKLFIDVIEKLEVGYRSAWDVELHGTTIVNDLGLNVYGTRQWPMRYANGLNSSIGKKAIFSGLTEEDIELIMPFIPEENR